MTSDRQTPEVHSADPKARRSAMVWLAGLVAVGFAGLVLWGNTLSDLSLRFENDPDTVIADIRWLFRGLAIAMGTGVLAMTVYILSISRAVARQRRFPPADMRVVRDTRVLRGKAAIRRAQLGRVLSAVLCVLGIALASAIWLLPDVLFGG